MDKQIKQRPSVLGIGLRAKALYLSTLPIIDEHLVMEYMAVIYPNEKTTLEKVTPVANLILLKYIWWYLKLFKSKVSDNENQFELFKSSLFSLFENNFRFSPKETLEKVDGLIPEDVYETNWFERETVNRVNKNEFGVLESLSALSIEKHFSLAQKTWNDVWRLGDKALMGLTQDLVRMGLEDYISKAKNYKLYGLPPSLKLRTDGQARRRRLQLFKIM